jgi:DUF1680 family protein
MRVTAPLQTTSPTDVSIDDPYLVNARAKTVAYLLRLEPQRLLHSVLDLAGLDPAAPPYGGWESTSGTRFQGHFLGHYLSALAQGFAGSTDPPERQALLDRLVVVVDGLGRAQDAYARLDPRNAGYVSAFPVGLLPAGGDGLLVPFYNLHKILAGLLQVHADAPAEQANRALDIADRFGHWLAGWAARQPHPAALLATEYGGMNDALYDLYAVTRRVEHRRAAEYFDETDLFRALAEGRDVLAGLHANTTIPKLIGALKRSVVLAGEADADAGMYRTAAERFWQLVVDDHSYANGGNSQSEHFHEAGSLHRRATIGGGPDYAENSTAEGCNVYNMLKLTRLLFTLTRDPKYADYYEGAFINSVLASQNARTGMVTYFQPMAAGYAKVFGREFDEFWCDQGTGIESFTKLGDSVYFSDETSVSVTMFRTSTARFPALNLRLRQTADVPSSAEVGFRVESLDGGPVAATLRLRVPWWAGEPALERNGEVVAAHAVDGFVVVAVTGGDELRYRVDARLTVDDATEDPNWVALRFGPVLLATALESGTADAQYEAGVLVRMSRKDDTVDADVLVDDADAWKRAVEQNLVRHPGLRFELRGDRPRVYEPYFALADTRYAIYSTLVERGTD